MPSGLTCNIKDGQSFAQFVWRCARQFGALITMRDDPNDAPIPQKFEPTGYHQEEIATIRTRIKWLNALTLDDANVEARKAYEQAENFRVQYDLERKELRAKYEAMLAQVNAWEPPTPDHQGLKELMQKQIEESIQMDCSDWLPGATVLLSGPDWKAKQLVKATKDLEYHQQKHLEEVERVNERNAWIAALRESVPPE